MNALCLLRIDVWYSPVCKCADHKNCTSVCVIVLTEMRNISMGQGQEVHARRLLSQGTQNGGWLLLQNCHLSLDFVDEVMDYIIETEVIHDEFRLWVTTEVHPKFPISFLQVQLFPLLHNDVCNGKYQISQNEIIFGIILPTMVDFHRP